MPAPRRLIAATLAIALVGILGRISYEVVWPIRLATIETLLLANPVNLIAEEGRLAIGGDLDLLSHLRWLVPGIILCVALSLAALASTCSRRAGQSRGRSVVNAVAVLVALLGTFLLHPVLHSLSRYRLLSESNMGLTFTVGSWSTWESDPKVLVVYSGSGPVIMPRHYGPPFDQIDSAATHQIQLAPARARELLRDLRSAGFFQLPEILDPDPFAWEHQYYVVGVYDGFNRHQVIAPFGSKDMPRLERVIATMVDKLGLGQRWWEER